MIRSLLSQKTVFLDSEGDAWFNRNSEAALSQDFSLDPVARAITKIAAVHAPQGPLSVLEIGAGASGRLQWLSTCNGIGDVQGIEPSLQAVESARARGLSVIQGVADNLPFADKRFDILVFGFCLYLCDRADLFRIAYEADRVLRDDGWIIIHDFYSEASTRRPYHHKSGIFSFKMDYRRVFDWHPAYTCFSHEIRGHVTGEYTDDVQEWVAVSVLRKRATPDA